MTHRLLAGIEALDQRLALFAELYDVADLDAGRRPRQRETAAAAAGGGQKACPRQFIDDLDQMIARDAVGLRHFVDRHALGCAECRLNENPQGEVGEHVDTHAAKLETRYTVNKGYDCLSRA